MRFRLAKPGRGLEAADRPPQPVSPGGPPEGGYLTDGRRLYRVVSHLYPARRGRHVGLLEDCLTLELAPYSPAELQKLGLVSVRGPMRAA